MEEILKVNKRGRTPGVKNKVEYHHICPTEILKKCKVCEKIKYLKDYDVTRQVEHVIYYNRKCRKCRNFMIAKYQKEKRKAIRDAKAEEKLLEK